MDEGTALAEPPRNGISKGAYYNQSRGAIVFLGRGVVLQQIFLALLYDIRFANSRNDAATFGKKLTAMVG